MRVYLTSGFSEAKEAWQDANRAYHAHLDANDVSLEEELHGPHSTAEDEALDRLCGYPATTPAEIAAKLAFMREREASNWTGYPAWMAQIERELIQLQRPGVSPAMAEAFGIWRTAWIAWCECQEGAGVEHNLAFMALMAAPCFTPGDFIVKVYVNQLGVHGTTYLGPNSDNPPHAFMFDIDPALLGECGGLHDGAAEEAFARDIRECDLGRCLLMLGQVDFDAEGWLEAAYRERMAAHVVIQKDGSDGLYVGEPVDEMSAPDGGRASMVLALLGAGLGEIGKERRTRLIEYIKAEHPWLVMDRREFAGATA